MNTHKLLTGICAVAVFAMSAGMVHAQSTCGEAFKPSQTVRVGMKNNASVKMIQQAINDIRGENLVIDGNFGKNTKAAVMRLQESIGSRPDGVAGPKTFAAISARYQEMCLGKESAKQYTHAVKMFGSNAEAEKFVKGKLAAQNTSTRTAMPTMAVASQEVATSTASADVSAGKSFSTTNIQEAGVDESDIIKTDGTYIYALSGGVVDVIKTKDNGALAKIATITLKDSSAQDMYLSGKTLVILSQKYEDKPLPMPDLPQGTTVSSDFRRPSYGVSYASVSIYSVQNPVQPTLKKSYDFEGNFLDSRVVDGHLYLVTKKYPMRHYGWDNILPMVREDGVSVKMISPIYYFDMSYSNYEFTQVHGISIADPEKLQTQTYLLSGGYALYGSNDAMYLSFTDYNHEPRIMPMVGGDVPVTNEISIMPAPETERTVIHKISITKGTSKLSATGSVPGTILNQFAFSEHKGNLRVATTTGNNWNGTQSQNNVYVLGSKLEVLGKLEGLAKGERIFAVRFMGDRAYLVTFEQVDPLFVIDLANPYKPSVLGELKVPGFSNYLHPYDANTILGIGRDVAVVDNGRVQQKGIKVSLFDVSNVAKPREIDSLVVGSEYSYSEALSNHKAVLFSKEHNLLVIPYSDSNYSGTQNDQFMGSAVFGIDTTRGITLKGKIAHGTGKNWEESITRNLYIDSVLYSLSQKYVQSNNIETLKAISQVLLTQSPVSAPVMGIMPVAVR
jgi:uncharacterized secreted protein with C-terminal beta-propeller domain